MGRRGGRAASETEAQTVRRWWRNQGEGVVEELRKVAYLQGQLDQTIKSLSTSLSELQQILEPSAPDKQEAEDA